MRTKGNWKSKVGLVAGTVAAMAAGANAQFKYNGCADVTDADFKLVTLVSNATDAKTTEPLKMDFDMDAQGNVDVYFTQRFGLLRRWNGATKTVTDIHQFTGLLTGSSDGLQGIALDPNFKSNKQLFLFYTGSASEWRVSRFTLNGNTLDLASEKIILKIVEDGPSQHPGGALAFDWDGNLVITVGDNNKSIQSANSNDLRGKILRIKPKADGSGYDIPAGNLRETFNTADKAKIRPEVFVMGARNPYTVGVDPVRKAYHWGDVGPDAGKITEEHNFTKVAGNFGWPFFAGENVRFGGGGTVEAPLNTDGSNTGVQTLPPAIPAIHSFKQSCAVDGPVYYFNSSLNSKVKFPPHFDGAWFNADFNSDTVAVMALNAGGTEITGIKRMFANMKFKDPLEFKMGPDGALYVVNYAGYRSVSSETGIYRIEYQGACQVPVGIGGFPLNPKGSPMATLQDGLVDIAAPGAHALEVKDMSGRTVLLKRGNGPAKYSLDAVRGAGVHIVSVRTPTGLYQAKLVR